MKLLSISIKNFKGIKELEHNFGGEDWTITAQNKSGKTSIYDACLWLLFGKDSDGRQDFSVRPLNKNNEVQSKLTIAVSAEIEIDGHRCCLIKENKKSTNGYTNRFWIDSVPKKALGQEIVGNRLIYSNIVENFNYNNRPNFTINTVPRTNAIELNQKFSLKTKRNYQLGITFKDSYGRETPVFTDKSGVLKLPQDNSTFN